MYATMQHEEHTKTHAKHTFNGHADGLWLPGYDEKQERNDRHAWRLHAFRYIHGFKEGIVLDAGPGGTCTKMSADSGCWYNVFMVILIEYTQRGAYIRDIHTIHLRRTLPTHIHCVCVLKQSIRKNRGSLLPV